MPTYLYRCPACGHRAEYGLTIEIACTAEVYCPACANLKSGDLSPDDLVLMKRVPLVSAIHLKGSGWASKE